MVGFIKTFEQYPQVKFWSLFQLSSKIVLKGFESEFYQNLIKALLIIAVYTVLY